MRVFCTHCLEEREVRYSTRQDTVMVRGEPITVDSEVAYCRVCENEIWDTDMAEKTLQSAYELYRKNTVSCLLTILRGSDASMGSHTELWADCWGGGL